MTGKPTKIKHISTQNSSKLAASTSSQNGSGLAKINLATTSPFKSPKSVDFDPDDPDYVKELRRPAVIKEDLNQMERNRRVKQILDSAAFRKELEKLVDQRGVPSDLSNLNSLEQLSDLILPGGHKITPPHNSVRGLHSSAIIPVADLRGAAGANYSTEERIARNKLASLFRLMDLSRWMQGILTNHCSFRIFEKYALTNPICLMNHEITAGQLLKVDLTDLSIVNPDDEQETDASVSTLNRSNFLIHSVIYKKRSDVNCIVPITTSVAAAVAAMKCGLLPLSQEAMIVGEVRCHEFQGYSTFDPQEAESIANDLGATSEVLLLRNNGFLICTSSIEKAHIIAYHLVLACETQIRAVRAGIDNLVFPTEEAQKKVVDLVSKVGGGGVNKVADPENAPKWKLGELEWEAWMRELDNAGYRTGHLYRNNLLNLKPSLPQSDVATPPCMPFNDGYDTTDIAMHRIGQSKREAERLRFLQQSPSYYQKDGRTSADLKKIASSRWVQSSSPSPGLNTLQPIRVTTTSHQFLPQTSPSISPNPKELKEKQKKIRQQYCIDNISAGPQSKILEGVSYQEAAALRHMQGTLADGQQLDEKILIGAASKGIVDRDHRHNAQIFSQLYQSNPFASETDQEIRKYVDEVEQKSRPLAFQLNSGTFDRFDEVVSGSASPESVSLMQAAREHNLSRSTTTTPPPTRTRTVVSRETTFDVSDKLHMSTKEQRPQYRISYSTDV